MFDQSGQNLERAGENCERSVQSFFPSPQVHYCTRSVTFAFMKPFSLFLLSYEINTESLIDASF